MKVSLKWVREFTDITISEEEIIDRIRSQIGEVESVTNYKEKYDKILLAKIVSKEAHPDAEKLAVYQVSTGNNEVTIVAGDKTLEPEEKVALFLEGAVVPYNAYPDRSDGVVRKTALRGVVSEGMMASEKELDLGPDHDFVMRFHTDMPVGTPISEVLEMDDTVIEIENKALTNRADLFGIIGISREIAGIQGNQFTSPDWYNSDSQLPETKGSDLPFTVLNEADPLCPRYIGASIKNIQIQDSPIWLQSILLRMGMRPINNIVDITNYVMLLFGQPLHAFDYDKLRNRDKNATKEASIVVRVGKKGERITALDGKTHELSDSNLLICDSSSPIAVAGIIGGLDTEVDEDTHNIILECANFDMYNVRKSSMQLGISTDAVTRFSKGQDPNRCQPAIVYAIKMIEELASGEVSQTVDLYPDQKAFPVTREIQININKANSHLGTGFDSAQIMQLLNSTELSATGEDEMISVVVPSFRRDIKEPVDLYEEIGRLHGYNNIEMKIPSRSITPVSHNQIFDLKKTVRKILSSHGASEVLTYSFTSGKKLKAWKIDTQEAYKLINSLSPELQYMRTALIPSLAEKARKNIERSYKQFSLYEINQVHSKRSVADDGLPIELNALGFIYCTEYPTKSSYYDTKRYLDLLMDRLNVRDLEYLNPKEVKKEALPDWILSLLPSFDDNAVAILSKRNELGSNILGIIGELSLVQLDYEKLPESTSAFQVDLNAVLQFSSTLSEYTEPSVFPYSSIDYSFVLDDDISYDSLVRSVNKVISSQKQFQSILEPVDFYQDDKLSENGKKYITIRVKIRQYDKSIEREDLDEISQKISKQVSKDLNGKLRE